MCTCCVCVCVFMYVCMYVSNLYFFQYMIDVEYLALILYVVTERLAVPLK